MYTTSSRASSEAADPADQAVRVHRVNDGVAPTWEALRAKGDAVMRASLPKVADLLKRRQAGLIDPHLIEHLVDLNWVEWQGGGLQLTVTGRNICRQVALASAR